MMNYYQPFLLSFLGTTVHNTTKYVGSKHYISFEDCFWNLLKSKRIKKHSYILFPDFYCMDVVNNAIQHGYRVAFYKVDQNFQITKKHLLSSIHTHHPSVVVLFHACGITNTLTYDVAFMKHISKTKLIIEDSVHTLINPENIYIHSNNHVLIDSLRKVTPLPGSFIYAKKNTIHTLESVRFSQDYLYIVKTIIYFLVFKTLLCIGFICKSSNIITYAHKTLLKKHDDIIGDNEYGHSGLPFIPFIHQFINFNKIEMKKDDQVKLYSKTLISLKLKGPWYFIDIPPKDYKHLHVFPLGLNVTDKAVLDMIENTFKEHNMAVWFKFVDSPWSRNRSVLFLPLGFHVTNDDIIKACSIISLMKII